MVSRFASSVGKERRWKKAVFERAKVRIPDFPGKPPQLFTDVLALKLPHK